MTRIRALLTVALVAVIAVAWWTFNSYSQQTARNRTAARPLPAPVLQPNMSSTLYSLWLDADRESFDMRQPQHIPLAGTLGLGVFDREKIDYRRVQLT